ncbi:hypothetical protein KEM52_006283 [Ascosphaera acerosa]|nr:hypothetical protein KEM52_006283 [Ascosphaera acerosa]
MVRHGTTSNDVSHTLQDVETRLETVEHAYRRLVTSRHVLSEDSLIQFLRQCRDLLAVAFSAEVSAAAATVSKARPRIENSTDRHQRQHQHQYSSKTAAASPLLSLDERSIDRARLLRPQPLAPAAASMPAIQQQVIACVSPMLVALLRDSKVFISEKLLRLYTELQCKMQQAEQFPEVFRLFATKPIPLRQQHAEKGLETLGSSPTAAGAAEIKHTSNSPDSPKSAIPADLARLALDVAIRQRNLPLALAILDTTFCTKAFRRAKIIRHAGLPAAFALTAPPGAYVAAKYASTFTTAMDAGTATWVSFSAILAYLTFTGAIGFVAIATANDQMQRVVWAPGTPLRERWVREEERHALDRIACAWGFKDPARRGEEEGEDWEALREIIGLRGMILDKSDLMDGME